MSESRICPVCKNEIPEDARYCPKFNFDQEILNYQEAVEREPI